MTTTAAVTARSTPSTSHPGWRSAQGEPPLGALGERSQHRRGLSRRPAGARGLDREHVLEVGDQLEIVGVPPVEVLGGGAVEHGRQRGRDLRTQSLHVGQRLADVLHRHGDLVLALERDLAGEHLEQHDAQRVEVGLAGDLVAERLLGGDVVGRAQHAAVGRQALLVERAGDAEVRHLRAALRVDQDVLGLDVAVDDVALMRDAERARDLDRVGDRLGDGEAAHAADAVLQRLALDVLEDDVGASRRPRPRR